MKTSTATQKLVGIIGRLLPSVKAHYSALEYDAMRRQIARKTKKTETENVFADDKRLRAYALADALYDDDSIGSTIDTCIRLTIGTKGGTRNFFLSDGTPDVVNQATWDAWMKTAGFYENENFHELLGMILRAVKVHGDCLILIDPDLTGNKLRIWDADQICPVSDVDFRSFCHQNGWQFSSQPNEKTYRQVQGAVLDTEGRVVGWFVTGRRNCYKVPLADASFIPASLGRRVSAHKKITGYRGEPAILGAAQLTQDTNSLMASEVASAKNYAEHSIIVKQKQTTSGLAAALSGIVDESGNISQDVLNASGVSSDITEQMRQMASAQASTFKALEGKAAVSFVDPDTDIHELSNANRPSQNIQSWMETLADQNGKRLGVMSCLARGRADNSYSSGQIELAISWAAFAEDQKMLERQVIDYAAGVICPGANGLTHWPSQFEIDPQKAEATYDARLRGGRTTYQEILGPDWKRKLSQLAVEKRYIEQLGLDNLSFFTTVAGARAVPTEPDNQEGTEL